jgi:hypothetical protein
MMDSFGHGLDGWGWVGMSLLMLMMFALVIAVGVWAARASHPDSAKHDAATAPVPLGHEARIAELEGHVAHLREQAHLTHRDGAGSRR